MKVTSTLDENSANVVTSGSPYGVVLRLATPTVLAMLTQSIVNEIDIVFFSWLPHPESSNAQAALFPSLILLWMFGGSLSAISVGTQAIAARRFAEGKLRDAGRGAGQLLVLLAGRRASCSRCSATCPCRGCSAC